MNFSYGFGYYYDNINKRIGGLSERMVGCDLLLIVSSEGVRCTVADPKLIFTAAIKAAASGIILSHNHPSGNLTPSQADVDLTRKLKEGGKLLEIQLLDHIIITSEGYYSFADEGLL